MAKTGRPRLPVPRVAMPFLASCKAAGCTENTLRAYRGDLRAFVAWCRARDIDAPNVSRLALRAYLVTQTERQRASIVGFLEWCVADGQAEDHAIAGFAFDRAGTPKPRKKHRRQRHKGPWRRAYQPWHVRSSPYHRPRKFRKRRSA